MSVKERGPSQEQEGQRQKETGSPRPQTRLRGTEPVDRAWAWAWRADVLSLSRLGARWLGLRGLVSAAGDQEAGRGPQALGVGPWGGVLTLVLGRPSCTGTTPTAGQP